MDIIWNLFFDIIRLNGNEKVGGYDHLHIWP